MKKKLSLCVAFLVTTFLIGATSWAAGPVTTMPKTTFPTVKPVPLKPAVTTQPATNVDVKSVSPPVAQAVKILPGIGIFSPETMGTVIKNSKERISWKFQGMQAFSAPSAVAKGSALSATSSGPTAPVNVYLLNKGGVGIQTIATQNTQGFFDWTVPGNLTAGIYNIQVETVDKKFSGKMPIIVEEYEPPPPAPPRPGNVECAPDKRTICGVMTLQDGLPAAGYRVTAYDSDFGFKNINRDDWMAAGYTDPGGVYRITYVSKAWDGPEALKKNTTTWRPDIYIVVHQKLPNGQWEKVYDEGKVFNDHKLADGLKINVTIPLKGSCPVPDKFSTRGFWHGCKCLGDTHKDYTLTRLKGEARCAPGPSNEEQCNARGPEWNWVGFDSTDGDCYKIGNFLLHRQGYYAFMKNVKSGVDFKPLPDWMIQRYQPWFTNVILRKIRIGDTSDSNETTSITDCTRIVFRPGVTESLYNDNKSYITLVLHEMAHADQCMSKTENDLGSARDQYADMWFGDIAPGVLRAFTTSNFSMSWAQMHDKMPMEVDADEKAAEIVLATGDGPPPGMCPYGKFSTRDYRGCRCPSGKSKSYEGIFKSQATCQ